MASSRGKGCSEAEIPESTGYWFAERCPGIWVPSWLCCDSLRLWASYFSLKEEALSTKHMKV